MAERALVSSPTLPLESQMKVASYQGANELLQKLRQLPTVVENKFQARSKPAK